jgi:hypothetical protein
MFERTLHKGHPQPHQVQEAYVRGARKTSTYVLYAYQPEYDLLKLFSRSFHLICVRPVRTFGRHCKCKKLVLGTVLKLSVAAWIFNINFYILDKNSKMGHPS